MSFNAFAFIPVLDSDTENVGAKAPSQATAPNAALDPITGSYAELQGDMTAKLGFWEFENDQGAKVRVLLADAPAS